MPGSPLKTENCRALAGAASIESISLRDRASPEIIDYLSWRAVPEGKKRGEHDRIPTREAVGAFLEAQNCGEEMARLFSYWLRTSIHSSISTAMQSWGDIFRFQEDQNAIGGYQVIVRDTAFAGEPQGAILRALMLAAFRQHVLILSAYSVAGDIRTPFGLNADSEAPFGTTDSGGVDLQTDRVASRDASRMQYDPAWSSGSFAYRLGRLLRFNAKQGLDTLRVLSAAFKGKARSDSKAENSRERSHGT